MKSFCPFYLKKSLVGDHPLEHYFCDKCKKGIGYLTPKEHLSLLKQIVELRFEAKEMRKQRNFLNKLLDKKSKEEII